MAAFSQPAIPAKNFMVLADGENLVFRFQEMLKNSSQQPGTVHIQDVFVWHQNLPLHSGWYPTRVNYYTSATGGDDKVEAIETRIAQIPVSRPADRAGQICPRVFKKLTNSRKTKLVDMTICIDALRHSNSRDVEAIYLLTGDGDYLPLIKEVMRNGTQVWLGAFSSGLSPKLRSSVDRFIDLDPFFLIKS